MGNGEAVPQCTRPSIDPRYYGNFLANLHDAASQAYANGDGTTGEFFEDGAAEFQDLHPEALTTPTTLPLDTRRDSVQAMIERATDDKTNRGRF